MTKTEIMTVKVYNPFEDKFNFCECYMEMSHEDNGKFIGGNLYEVITEGGCDLMHFLNDDKLDDIEQECLESYEG